MLELTERLHIVSLDKPHAGLQSFIGFGWGWVVLAEGLRPVFIWENLPVSIPKVVGVAGARHAK